MSSVISRREPPLPARQACEALQCAMGRLYAAMTALASLLLLLMVVAITIDVLLRNAEFAGLPRGFPASNDLSEYGLYFCTLLAAPGLLRAGQHIRVDILLRAIPPRLAWACEWLSDVLALVCCAVLAWVGVVMAARSYASGAVQIKSVIVPEWWLLAPLPVAFGLLALEFAFRMWRLADGPKEPRSHAVSAP
jgi:TRAP-type C4-dicarboxylate transport system permease small subunit